MDLKPGLPLSLRFGNRDGESMNRLGDFGGWYASGEVRWGEVRFG